MLSVRKRRTSAEKNYGELVLYLPWKGRDEATEFGGAHQDLDTCQARHLGEKAAIDRVKEGLKNLLLDQM